MKETYKTNENESDQSKKINSYHSKKKEAKELLIKLQFDGEIEPIEDKYISYKKKQKYTHKEIDFLEKSQYRFILNHDCKTIKENSLSHFDYADIYLVIYFSSEEYKCPICLSFNLISPIVTRCGHIFCWHCICSYIYYYKENKNSLNKNPKCPLCSEKVELNNLRFCKIIESKNYICRQFIQDNSLRSRFSKRQFPYQIVFNLVMRSKCMIYNVNLDPDLSIWTSNYKDVSFPLEDCIQGQFSLFFKTNLNLKIKRFEKYLRELKNELKNEENAKDESIDEKKIYSISMCIEYLNNELSKLNSKKQEEHDNENYFSNQNSFHKIDIGEAIDNKKFMYQENNGDIYYMHPLNFTMLLSNYKKVENLPTLIKVLIIIFRVILLKLKSIT